MFPVCYLDVKLCLELEMSVQIIFTRPWPRLDFFTSLCNNHSWSSEIHRDGPTKEQKLLIKAECGSLVAINMPTVLPCGSPICSTHFRIFGTSCHLSTPIQSVPSQHCREQRACLLQPLSKNQMLSCPGCKQSDERTTSYLQYISLWPSKGKK